jgi:hypothetical protein
VAGIFPGNRGSAIFRRPILHKPRVDLRRALFPLVRLCIEKNRRTRFPGNPPLTVPTERSNRARHSKRRARITSIRANELGVAATTLFARSRVSERELSDGGRLVTGRGNEQTKWEDLTACRMNQGIRYSDN